MHVWLNALGRFVEDENRGIRNEGSGNGELLLLTSGEVATPSPAHFPEDGKNGIDLIGNDGLVRSLQPHLEVFLDRKSWKDLAPLRHVTDAGDSPLVGGSAGEVLADERYASFAKRLQSHDVSKQSGLAHAVAAHDANNGSCLDVQIQTTQHLNLTVGEFQIPHLQQSAHRPR